MEIKAKTPAQEEGFSVGDKAVFTLQRDEDPEDELLEQDRPPRRPGSLVGDILELVEDDGTDIPVRRVLDPEFEDERGVLTRIELYKVRQLKYL